MNYFILSSNPMIFRTLYPVHKKASYTTKTGFVHAFQSMRLNARELMHVDLEGVLTYSPFAVELKCYNKHMSWASCVWFHDDCSRLANSGTVCSSRQHLSACCCTSFSLSFSFMARAKLVYPICVYAPCPCKPIVLHLFNSNTPLSHYHSYNWLRTQSSCQLIILIILNLPGILNDLKESSSICGTKAGFIQIFIWNNDQ